MPSLPVTLLAKKASVCRDATAAVNPYSDVLFLIIRWCGAEFRVFLKSALLLVVMEAVQISLFSMVVVVVARVTGTRSRIALL